MSDRLSTVELIVHLTNGTVERFIQTDPEASADLLDKLSPGKLFSDAHMILSGTSSLTAYRVEAINMIELIAEELPDWVYQTQGDHAHQITQQEFMRRISLSEEISALMDQPSSPGEKLVALVEVEFRGGEKINAVVHSSSSMPFEQMSLVQRLFNSPFLISYRMGKGVNLINTKNIIRFERCPGTEHVPVTAIKASHVIDPK